MYVCVCNAVTERQLADAVQAGAASLHELKRPLGVAGECGRCAQCALDCLRRDQRAVARSQPGGAFLPVVDRA